MTAQSEELSNGLLPGSPQPLRGPGLMPYNNASLSSSLKEATQLQPSPADDYFRLGQVGSLPTPKRGSPPTHVDMPKLPLPVELALVALQYLPTPLLVLSDLKKVVLANDAFGLLLGLNKYDAEEEDLYQEDKDIAIADLLEGQTLSQIGIDLVQDGQPIWVSWEVGPVTKRGLLLSLS